MPGVEPGGGGIKHSTPRAGTGSSSVDVTVPREGDYEVCLQIPSPDMLYQRYLALAAQTAKEY